MVAKTYRGVVQEGRVVLDKGVTLPDGTSVTVIAQPSERGTAAAVLAAIEAGPAIPPEDVRELERIIREGEGAPAPVDVFGEDGGESVLGDPAAVLAVMRSGPRIPPEDVDELERIIAEDQGPPAEVGPFSDEAGWTRR